MALPRPTSPILRSLSVVGIIAGLLVGGAASGHAAPGQPAAPSAPAPPAPKTAAEALTQLRAFNEKFEQVTEKYNEAQIALGKRRAEAGAADKRARAAAAEYAAMDLRARKVIAGANRTDPFGEFGVLFSSGSAQDYVDQLALLELVAKRRNAVLARAGQSRKKAVAAQADARRALAAAGKLSRELASQRKDLASRAAQSKAMFDRLSARERQQFLAAQARQAQAQAQDRASRSTPRASTPQQPAAAPPASVPASGRAAVAVEWARKELGKPYVWAASGPDAFDCSGLTMYVWGKAGVALPHSSGMQYNVGTRVSRSALQPGDLVFFGSPIHHVGIYVGGGQMIHAPQTGDVVRYASIDMGNYVGATRPG